MCGDRWTTSVDRRRSSLSGLCSNPRTLVRTRWELVTPKRGVIPISRLVGARNGLAFGSTATQMLQWLGVSLGKPFVARHYAEQAAWIAERFPPLEMRAREWSRS